MPENDPLPIEHAHALDEVGFLRAVLGVIDALVVVLDRDGEILYTNDQASQATGYSQSELLGRSYVDLLAPDEVESVKRVFESLRQGAKRSEHENDWVSKQGTSRRIAWKNTSIADKDGVVRYIVGTGIDITQTRRAQKALRDSEARLRGILKTAVDAIVVIDRLGAIELFNPAAESMFGYTSQEVLGENVKVLMPSPYKEAHDGYLESYARTGRKKIIGIGREVIGKRKDGSTFPIDLSVSEVRTGERLIYTGVIRDITERKSLEKEILTISEAEQRRIGQDLHDSLGQQLTGLAFLSGVLHQKLVARAAPESAEADRIAQEVDRAIDHTRRLSRGLSPVDLVGNLQPALMQLANDVKELTNMDCVVDCDPIDLDDVTAIHLYRIAQEAVNNAVKHGHPKRLHIDLKVGKDDVTLAIIDDGMGMPRQFDTAKGAGMRNMKHRAHIIDGVLAVTDNAETPDALAERGTTVACRFRLPLCKEE